MEEEISKSLPLLIAAVETAMDPAADNRTRLEAHRVYEQFRDASPVCYQCGLIMARREHSHIVRHFGLQLLEHFVKFRWNEPESLMKEQLKRSAMELIANGTEHIMKEELHIRDAVSRIIVEIIKHEWPQLWPDLLKELNDLCHMGETQTELVLKVLLRLVEDVVAFQKLPIQRRRAILQALTTNMADLFSLFTTLLIIHMEKYQSMQPSADEEVKARSQAHCRVSAAVLVTLTGYVDWVPMTHIIMNNAILLQSLCALLSVETLQLQAAECLLLIVSRKGKAEDRKPILILFSEDAMSTIWDAAVLANNASTNEYYYLFLKRLCQVLIEIGKQLCFLSATLKDAACPAHFNTYLEAVMCFTRHPSQMLSTIALTLWSTLLRHEIMSQDALLLSFIPKVMDSCTRTLIKVGLPSMTNSPSCDYSRLDFDSDEEFTVFFSQFRSVISGVIRQATVLNPKYTFQLAVTWLESQLQKPIETGPGSESGFCNLSSPSFLEWDALTTYLEGVMARLAVPEKFSLEGETGFQLFQAVVEYNTNDPLILSSLLSCMSALFPFHKHSPDILPRVLEKIFASVVFNRPGQTKATRSRGVWNVRQHACSMFVKLSSRYPEVLFPVFDDVYKHVESMASDPEQLSQMEKCILTEALILISNQFQDFKKQTAVIEDILKPVKLMWLSDEFYQTFQSSRKFMSYVGLDQAAVEPSSADTCGINRSHILNSIHTILAVMKRSKWPTDPEIAKKNGFVIGTFSDGSPIYRNPATSHIIILLENLLNLCKTLNALWEPEMLALRHQDFRDVYELQGNDRLAVFGIQPPCIDNIDAPICKRPSTRMQGFFTNAHDHSYHILGNAGIGLGYEFYAAPRLAPFLLSTVFTNLDLIPDQRLRIIIRGYMKPFIQHCPKECYVSTVMPVLANLCQYMLQRLGARWKEMNQQCHNNADNEDENADSQEALEDQLTRQLTREYIELLALVCLANRSEEAPNDDEDGNPSPAGMPGKDGALSSLGQLCVKTHEVYPSLLLCVFGGLSWNDTGTCSRCLMLCTPLLGHVTGDISSLMNSEGACHIFLSVLYGLQTHGQHDTFLAMLITLGAQLYEVLRPHFPDITKVLLQIPNCTPSDVQSFEDKFFGSNKQKQVSEKRKKELFKKVVSEIIGKNIGQQFTKEAHYEVLPYPWFTKKRTKPSILDDETGGDIGLCHLFQPDSDAT